MSIASPATWNEVSWDTMAGPRGKGPLVAGPQNRVVEKYPNRLYFKIDEDIIVPPGWVDRMTAAYERHKDDPKLALCTPVVTNNSTGAHFLMELYPELATEYTERFQAADHPRMSPAPCGNTLKLQSGLSVRSSDSTTPIKNSKSSFPNRGPATVFSINDSALTTSYTTTTTGKHWEVFLTTKNLRGQRGYASTGNIMCWSAIACSITTAFFVQQDWLDRTTLLEDLRHANLPPALHHSALTKMHPTCRPNYPPNSRESSRGGLSPAKKIAPTLLVSSRFTRHVLPALGLLLGCSRDYFFGWSYAWDHPLTGDEVVSNMIASGHRGDWETHLPTKPGHPLPNLTRLLAYDPDNVLWRSVCYDCWPSWQGPPPACTLPELYARGWVFLAIRFSPFAASRCLCNFLAFGLAVLIARRVLGNAQHLSPRPSFLRSHRSVSFSLPMARPYPDGYVFRDAQRVAGD